MNKSYDGITKLSAERLIRDNSFREYYTNHYVLVLTKDKFDTEFIHDMILGVIFSEFQRNGEKIYDCYYWNNEYEGIIKYDLNPETARISYIDYKEQYNLIELIL